MRPFAPRASLALFAAAFTGVRAQPVTPRTVVLPAPSATLAAEFTLVTGVRELADGRVLVVDYTEKKLVVADWTKTEVTQLGRNGSGPGEYVQPANLFAIGGDSTLLADQRSGRWLLLRGASIVATVGADAPAIMSGARLPLGADTQGHVLFTRAFGAGARASAALPRLDSTLLFRVARTTGQTDTIGALRARPRSIVTTGPANNPTSVSVFINPLGAGEVAALFPDGWIAMARLEPYRVDWIAPDGKRVRGSPLPFERIRLDEGEQRAFVLRLAARTGKEPRDPKSFPEWPEMMPPFLNDGLLAAPDGRLWIQRPATAANPSPPYDVIDRHGALVARVTAGKDVQVVGFGRSAVYTVATDDNGVQQVQRRPFPRW